jgi:uncharacterized protein YndB with AHSA1/START domain
MLPQAQEITITRTIFTPPAQIYAAFISAEGWCEWCCEKAEVDARIGGKYHIYTEGYNAYGEFTALEPDKVVAFTWDGDAEPPVQIQVLLNGQEDSTIITFKVTVLDPCQEWADFAGFLERTWGRALNNLKAMLEEKAEASIRGDTPDPNS